MSGLLPRVDATWLWDATGDIREIAAFVTTLRGVDDRVAALAVALRANGIAVSCLGSGAAGRGHRAVARGRSPRSGQ